MSTDRTPLVDLALRDDDVLYDKLSIIIDSLDNLHQLDKTAFLKQVFEAAFLLIPEAQKGSLYELRDGRYRPIFSRGYDEALLSRLTFGESEAFVDFTMDDEGRSSAYETLIIKRNSSAFNPETLELFRRLGTDGGFRTLYAPIRAEGKTFGLISLEKFDDGDFGRFSRKILQYYAWLISEFYAQRLRQEQETGHYREVIGSLISAIEVNDSYTNGHGRRVAAISGRLGMFLGLEPPELRDLHTAALLHDIGKIGVPSEILRKPGGLDEREYSIVKRHPVDSAKILGGISGFARVVELALRHHERYDGTGYPEGLSGDQLPLSAYVLQLADSFDAMTSDRAYRPARPILEALAEIRAGSGRQFHPRVAEAAILAFAG